MGNVDVTQIDGRRRIVLPQSVCDLAGLKTGDLVKITATKQSNRVDIRVHPVEVIDKVTP